MCYVLDDLSIAAGGLRVVCTGSQRRGRSEARPLLSHSFHFPFLRLCELRRNDNQTQIDHEERSDLMERRTRQWRINVQGSGIVVVGWTKRTTMSSTK